jgi:hypothetical protein
MIDFFVEPDGLLDAPKAGTGYIPACDLVFCQGFYYATQAIATRYALDYMVAREKIAELRKRQSVFSLYGICVFAVSGEGYVAEELTKLSKIRSQSRE